MHKLVPIIFLVCILILTIFAAFAWAIVPASPHVDPLSCNNHVTLEKQLELQRIEDLTKPKLCVIYACCHGIAIEYLLRKVKEFNDVYKIVRYENIWFNKDDPLPTEFISKADIFIYNVVLHKGKQYNTDNVCKLLPAHCQKISLPYGYSAGVWGIFPMWQGNKSKGNIIYELKQNGMTLDEILAQYQVGALDVRYDERHKYSMDILLSKESETDCHMYPIIEKYFKTHRLFLTCNHPTFYVFVHVVNQILELLKLNHRFDPEKYCYGEGETSTIDFLPPKEECIYKLAPHGAWLLSKWDVKHWKFQWKTEPDVGADEFYCKEIKRIYDSV